MDLHPEPAFPVSAGDAFAQAAWWTRYALDALPEADASDDIAAKAVRCHAKAALTHHRAIEEASQLVCR